MKNILAFLGIILITSSLFGQDKIYLKTGDNIVAKVLEITPTQLKYKKFSNIEGPTYTIDKSTIQIVVYQNGESEIFDDFSVNNDTKRNSQPEYQRESIFNNPEFVNQKTKKGIQFEFDIAKLEESNEIVWYGWDFKPLVINDPRQADDVKEIIGFNIPKIIELLNKQFTEKSLAKRFKEYDQFSLNLIDISKRNSEINPESLVQVEETTLTIEGIKSVVASYNLSQKGGTGFVVILENFNKPHRYVSSFITFFDIETREVLYTTRMKGLPGSKWGYSHYWFEGVLETLAYFFSDKNLQLHETK